MSFDAAQIQQGNRVRAELKSQPATFATDSGVPKITPGKKLTSQRFYTYGRSDGSPRS